MKSFEDEPSKSRNSLVPSTLDGFGAFSSTALGALAVACFLAFVEVVTLAVGSAGSVGDAVTTPLLTPLVRLATGLTSPASTTGAACWTSCIACWIAGAASAPISA